MISRQRELGDVIRSLGYEKEKLESERDMYKSIAESKKEDYEDDSPEMMYAKIASSKREHEDILLKERKKQNEKSLASERDFKDQIMRLKREVTELTRKESKLIREYKAKLSETANKSVQDLIKKENRFKESIRQKNDELRLLKIDREENQ